MDLQFLLAQPNNHHCFFLLCVHSPFDVEDLTPSTGNVSKTSALQRRMSMYSQGTPETPTFKDHSFFVSSVQLHVYVMRSPRAVPTLQMLHCFTHLSFFYPGSNRLPLQSAYKASAFLAANPKRRWLWFWHLWNCVASYCICIPHSWLLQWFNYLYEMCLQFVIAVNRCSTKYFLQ